MDRVVPWSGLCVLIEPVYPKPGNGRPPIGVERMLRTDSCSNGGDEVLRRRRVLPGHCPLAAIRLVAPHAGFVPVQQIGEHDAVGDIGWHCHGRVDRTSKHFARRADLYRRQD